MHHHSILFSFVVAIVSPAIAFGELPELLVPVTGSEEASARAYNDHFLQKHTYAAKRHRIMKVKAGLLMDAEVFTVTLFDDVIFGVSTVKRDVRQNGAAILANIECISVVRNQAR